MFYETVVEVCERVSASGEIQEKLGEIELETVLKNVFMTGIRAVAIVFLRGYRFSDHELLAANIAKRIGFTQISLSHEISPLMKLISRGDTTVMDAYFSPILQRYIKGIIGTLGKTQLMFMRSNGGLTHARLLQGQDSILSGPAGGGFGKQESQE